jgi:hypothetical protein
MRSAAASTARGRPSTGGGATGVKRAASGKRAAAPPAPSIDEKDD